MYAVGVPVPVPPPAPSPSENVAGVATVSSSSQNSSSGQFAVKAVDGVIAGFPGDFSRESATVRGGVGSYLNLGWSSAQTLDRVVLFDRVECR